MTATTVIKPTCLNCGLEAPEPIIVIDIDASCSLQEAVGVCANAGACRKRKRRPRRTRTRTVRVPKSCRQPNCQGKCGLPYEPPGKR